jgi:hypothetical protein
MKYLLYLEILNNLILFLGQLHGTSRFPSKKGSSFSLSNSNSEEEISLSKN